MLGAMEKARSKIQNPDNCPCSYTAHFPNNRLGCIKQRHLRCVIPQWDFKSNDVIFDRELVSGSYKRFFFKILPTSFCHNFIFPVFFCIALHCPALPCITMHYPALPCISMLYPALPCITLHYHISSLEIWKERYTLVDCALHDTPY